MSNTELHFKPITEQAAMLRGGELSPVELTAAYLDRIADLNGELGAYITVMGEQAMSQAQQAESEMQAGEDKGALHGIPVAIKDIIYTEGTLTSGGSKVLADFIPDARFDDCAQAGCCGRSAARQAKPQRVRHRRDDRSSFRNSAQSVEYGPHCGRV